MNALYKIPTLGAACSLLFLMLAWLCATPAMAQTWWHYYGATTYAVSAFAVTAQGEQLVAIAGGGILRSSDHGATWVPMNTGLGYGIVTYLYRHRSGTLFASTSFGRNPYRIEQATSLLRWHDKTRMWEAVSFPGKVAPLCMAEDSSGRVYACIGTKQLYRSDDTGTTWSLITTFSQITDPSYVAVTVVAADPDGSLLAGICGTYQSYLALVLRSRDGGTTWKWMNPNSPDGQFRWIVADITALGVATDGALIAATHAYYSGLYVTRNDGAIWAEPSCTHLSTMRAIVADGAGGLYLGTTPGILRSTDNGTRWAPADSTITETIFSVAGDTTGAVSAMGSDRLYWTADNGNTWQKSDPAVLRQMADEISYADVCAITSSPIDWIGQLLAGTRSRGALVSRDHGHKWRRLRAVLPLDTVTAVAACGYNVFYAAGPEGLYVSRDTGNSWHRTNAAQSDQHVTALGVGRGGEVVVIVDSSEILRSTDTGATWLQIDPGSMQAPYACLTLTRNDTLLIAAADHVYISIDFCDHLMQIGPPLPSTAVTAVAFAGGRKLFLGTPEGLLFAGPQDSAWWSTDGDAGRMHIYALDVTGYNAVLVGTDNGLYATGDFGIHWTQWVNGMTERRIRALTINPLEETVFIGTHEGGMYEALYFKFAVDAQPTTQAEVPALTIAPNPMHNSTTFTLNIPQRTHVHLTLYSPTGEQVSDVVDEVFDRGTHEVPWQRPDIASGLYFYRIIAGNNSVSGTIVLQ